MGFFSEFRYPSRWYTKLAIALLALAIFAFLAATAASGYLIYRMVFPLHSHSEVEMIDLQNFPGHPVQLNFTVKGEGQREGWFFPGLRGAPTVVVCHGYLSQDQQYNVFVFDFSAHGAAGGRSTLGFQEVAELRAAVDAVANRGDVNANRVGLWGANMGAYVALVEATNDHRIRAIVADSPYDHPKDMVALLIARSGLGPIPLITKLTQAIFEWLNPEFRNVPRLSTRIQGLEGVAQLYLETPDEPSLASSTSRLFQLSPPPHELAILPHGNYSGMLDDEKRAYENRIVSFFLANLPPTREVQAQ
jgi:pimeloyl-ACP methyl ester carboxylesterase